MPAEIHCGIGSEFFLIEPLTFQAMIVLNVNHNDYHLLLKDFADLLQIPFNSPNKLSIIEPAGKGVMKALNLYNEIQVLLTDACFNDTIVTIREKKDDRFYILHFDDVTITNTVKFQVDDEQVQKTNMKHSVARLTSNLFTNTETIPAGQYIKSVKILLHEKWMKNYLGLDEKTDVLHKYLMLKTESFELEPLDGAYMKLLDELWTALNDEQVSEIFIQNRVGMLIERFFTRIHEKLNSTKIKFRLSEDEMKRLLQIEQDITRNISIMPPTIDQFAKMASMSSTKLKKNFKNLFGDSIYSYYQKHRMLKAKELMMAKKYTVKQVAREVGYDNVSNFITAFKKQFHLSPGSLVEEQSSSDTVF